MKEEGINSASRRFIQKILLLEIALILGLAIILWLLEDNSFIMCCYKSACLMSMSAICHLGIEVFSSLDDNRWRYKLARNDYPILKAVVLIVLNAMVFLLTAPFKKAYIFFIVPLAAWVMLLLLNKIHRFIR
ncbi:MAG: hypothetical protein IJ156_00905 [Bacteroidales bacterium]|nr:hypothetical protein [Bacteroidales bacterium]